MRLRGGGNKFLKRIIYKITERSSSCFTLNFSIKLWMFQFLMSDLRPSRIGKITGLHPLEFSLYSFFTNVTPKHTSWNPSYEGCTWKGITCNSQRVITQISLIGLGFGGELKWSSMPQTVQHLKLQSEVRVNCFSGNIPFASVSHALLEFFVQGNHFSGEADLGALPPFLRSLDITCNDFSGSVVLSSLPCDLTELRLSENQFKGALLFAISSSKPSKSLCL